MPRPNARRELDDYVDVATRLHQFREKYPEGSIQTDVYADDGKVVRVKALAFREDAGGLAPIGTGHAEEIRGDGFVNKTSALENCETSAVGRALAMAGFEVKQGIASKQEVEQAKAEEQRQQSDVGVIVGGTGYQRQEVEAKQNDAIDLDLIRQIRGLVVREKITAHELGLVLVAAGVENMAVRDWMTKDTFSLAEAKQAARSITQEQADALVGALDTGSEA